MNDDEKCEVQDDRTPLMKCVNCIQDLRCRIIKLEELVDMRVNRICGAQPPHPDCENIKSVHDVEADVDVLSANIDSCTCSVNRMEDQITRL